MTRRDFFSSSTLGATTIAGLPTLSGTVRPIHVPNFKISRQVAISIPDKALEESFWIAVRLTADMRRLAFQHYGKDGWLAVSDGKINPEHDYAPRDFRYGSKVAVYLYGDDPSFSLEMGKRIFLDEIKEGRIFTPDNPYPEIAQTVKHFSDYISYQEQDDFVKENWERLLKMARWLTASYDPNDDGLMKNEDDRQGHLMSLLVGENMNFSKLHDCHDDLVVIENMEICELFKIMSDYAAQRGLPGSDWLESRAYKTHAAIETRA